jgi:hypothetical protein
MDSLTRSQRYHSGQLIDGLHRPPQRHDRSLCVHVTPGGAGRAWSFALLTASSGSQIVYIAPALMLLVVAPLVRRMGEPLRSVFRPPSMTSLLARHGFRATRDVSVAHVASSMSLALPAGGLTARHHHIVSTVRVDGGRSP